MRKTFLLMVLMVAGAIAAQAQNLGEWQVYPSFSTITDIAVAEDRIYSATLGGIFIVEDGEVVRQISTMDGLYRSNPTTIVYDEAGNQVFAGYIDGMIDVIDAEDFSVTRLQDINRVSRFSSRSINELQLYEGSLYVATSFGIVVYDLDQLLVENSFTRIGMFDPGIPVHDLDIGGDTLYAATDQGVAIGALADNLAESDNWQSYNSNDGLQANVVDEIVKTNERTFALVSDSLYALASDRWLSVVNVDNGDIENIARSSDASRFALVTDNEIGIKDGDQPLQTTSIDLDGNITAFNVENEGIYIGTGNEGLFMFDTPQAEPTQMLPTGPYLNFFNNMLVDGHVLVATSSDIFPQTDPLNIVRGYYIFEDGEWQNYNRNTNEVLLDYRVANVNSVGQTDSAYYLGSWGSGVIEHRKSDGEITVYNAQNSALRGLSSSTSGYMVIPAVESDTEGNVWATSFLSQFPLNVKMAGSDEWIPFRGLSGDDNYFNMLIDSNNKKWISLRSEGNAGLGLLVINTGNPETSEDDQFVKLTSNPNNGNLPDEKVNAIVEDKNNEVWIGTARGIARFIYPELIVEGGSSERQAQWLINEDTTASSRYLLRDVNVTAIAVNDANQKWIGSQNQGLWLLNEEGSRIERRLTTENTNLISDNIESIAINNETGQVYVATDLGLVSLQDVPLAPVKSMDKLKVFPNPFRYDRHNQIVIEGLSGSTQLKILGVDGVVVNELEATGGRVSWDGHDYNGNQLGTGVYYVVAYESGGGERGLGKVVIVR